MKILVLTHEFPPVGGGGGHVSKDLSEGLAALGHDIKVLTTDLIGGIDRKVDHSDRGYELIRIASLRKDPARASLLAMISFIISSVVKGIFLIRKWKPDLIHVHFAVPAGPIAWILSKISGIPYVLTTHLGDVPGGTPEKTECWFRFVKPFTYPIWKDAKTVIAVSEFTRQLALDHYPVSIKVIHNGVDTAYFYPGIVEIHHPPRIVFAGRFVPQKNPLQVIRVLEELADLEWELVMIGDGELMAETRDEIQKRGLEERVRLLGWVSPEDVRLEMRRSDLLFMPSLSEGLPVVGVQALAAGLAFVVSDIGGFRDLVKHKKNGYLCELDKEDSFLIPLKKLLSNWDMLTAFRQESVNLSASFDINQIVLSYERMFYDNIASTQP